MSKRTIILTGSILCISILTLLWQFFTPKQPGTLVLSFDTCLLAGYSTLETSPRQCKTPAGIIFTEEVEEKPTNTLQYTNATADNIVVELPFPEATISKEFTVTGKARGTWFFEASFPIEVLDKNGVTLARGVARAEDDWMTTKFVPFKADITLPKTYTGKATLILKKDNPSGLPENEASISFSLTVE